jgi:hypothetical protein
MIQKYVEVIRDYKITPKTILEIGSRDGHDSHFFQKEFNILDNNVFLVEPNPDMFNRIKETYPNYKVFNVAIDETEGVKSFNQVLDGGAYGMDPIGVSSLLDRTDDFYQKFETKKNIPWIEEDLCRMIKSE